MAELEVLNGVAAGTIHVLGEVPSVIGRSPEAHLQIADPWISSMHAMFERRDDGVWVVDLESRNGTFLGEERIAESPVADGEIVRLGRTEVRLALGEAQAGRRPPAAPHLVPAGAPTASGTPRPPSTRATGPTDATHPGRVLAAVRDPSTDPYALANRPATVLRLALDSTGLTPDAGTAALVRAALETAATAGVEAGGLVSPLAGIGVLVLFGLEGRPDPADPERALGAARAARAAVRALGLDLRAAVESGQVLAGRPGGASHFDLVALGPAAARAERLAALARPGEILAGPGAAPAPGLVRVGLVRLGDEELEVFRDEG